MVTLSFKSTFSKTASIIKSLPSTSFGLSVGIILDKVACFFSSDDLPLEIALLSSSSEYDLPFFAPSIVTSFKTTSIPALAETYAIPEPIIPAPKIPTLLISYLSSFLGLAFPFAAP